jgi:L-methionine (R)-S-oxide reductase
MQRRTVLVPDVEAYPGHIACDGETESEIVCPLILHRADGDIPLGVLDLDCLAPSGFTEEDKVGLEKIARLIVDACDW